MDARKESKWSWKGLLSLNKYVPAADSVTLLICRGSVERKASTGLWLYGDTPGSREPPSWGGQQDIQRVGLEQKF